ncbi:hypothetical protein DFH08DRAFT_840174 [Mycena albidolilacea]|uniref:Uncharacterized protein n=1 Tax=Mycena albidolilacea TaxID=1033008 RepID=A0AAD7F4H1_9AGAR|nr:hypothetical protein DFH08DRAFT_840174 [Mycena albidolilacea]
MCNGIAVFTAGRIRCVNAVAVIFFLASVLLPPPGMTAATFLVLFGLNAGCKTLSSESSSDEQSDGLSWSSMTS